MDALRDENLHKRQETFLMTRRTGLEVLKLILLQIALRMNL